MILLIIIVLNIAVYGREGIPERELRVVSASEILAKIQQCEPIEYDHILVKGDMNLSQLRLHKNITSAIRINDSILDGFVEFKFAVFDKVIDLSGSNFSYETDFVGSTFSQDANFSETTFNMNADFSGATFKGGSVYISLPRPPLYEPNVVLGVADFRGAKFKNAAKFSESTFNNAHFNGAEFLGGLFGAADFGGATFIEAYFGKSTFNYADFNGATFDYADFNGATFGSANFYEATFNNSDFSFTTFIGPADFQRAIFIYYADFFGAKFNSIARFWGSTFNDDCDFDRATFNDAEFNGVTFKGYLFGWDDIETNIDCDEETYLRLIRNLKDHGQFNEADDCYYIYRYRNMNSLSDVLGWISCGFGVRPMYAIYFSIILIFLFGSVYWIGNGIYKLANQHQKSTADKGRMWSPSSIWNSLFSVMRERANDLKYMPNRILRYFESLRIENILEMFSKFWHKSFTTNISFKDALYFSALVFFTLHPPHDWEYSKRWRYVVLLEDILGGVFMTLFIVTLGNIIIRY